MTTAPTDFAFDNSYAKELEGMYAPWEPSKVPAPRWLKFNRSLALELGLNADALEGERGLAVFSGNVIPEGATPIAQAYAGHQFGGFSPQLGDGRALLLGELVDPNGQRRDIALKGSGRTPFSRGGDGKAAIGPVLREYLISESMHAMGIPTTRSLAAVATGEQIYRDRPLPGAVLTRVAASHIRVGTFQFFAARGAHDKVRQLADYVIDRHYPDIKALQGSDRYLALLDAVQERQARLVAQWMGAAFIHGVMNTDNMTLSGETIDYGPCAFMEVYDPDTVFSSIDHGGRYAYGNQPGIAQWNLTRLAETLLPLIDTDNEERAVQLATSSIEQFPDRFDRHWLKVHRRKLGLNEDSAHDKGDRELLNDLLRMMHAGKVDFTSAFRQLADTLTHQSEPWLQLMGNQQSRDEASAWLERWKRRVGSSSANASDVATEMNRVNPIHIPRNHLVENALEAAVDSKDMRPFERLLAIISRPFDADPANALAALPGTPEQTQGFRTFCGT